MATQWSRALLLLVVCLGSSASAMAQSETPPQYFFGAEYLLWNTRAQTLPTLVTSGPVTDPVPAALGQGTTRVLLDGKDTAGALQSGFRVNMGLGIDPEQVSALDVSFFFIGDASSSRTFASAGDTNSPVLGRPFFNTSTGFEDTDPIAIPGITSGRIQVTSARRLFGSDINYRYQYYNSQDTRLTLLFGGRYLELQDSVGIHEDTMDLPSVDVVGNPVTGNKFSFREDYRTLNRFFGGQVGAEYGVRVGPVLVLTTGKVAFGSMNQTYTSSAFSSVTDATGVVTTSSDRALLLSPGNVGRFSASRFAVASEAGLKVILDLNENLKFTIGYSGMIVSNVARAADQIDRNATVQPIGISDTFGPAPQTPRLRDSQFWAHGLDVGLGFAF